MGLHTAQNRSQWTDFFRASPCGLRERKSKRDDNEGPWDGALLGPIVHPPHEGWWRMADGVQWGWGSLLVKSHLRLPFTLNMGHCSCPDLGFDPQRCLTPTFPPELPPAIWSARMHMYKYAHTLTDTYACAYIHLHMFPHRYGVRFCSCWCLFSNIPFFGMLATFCVFVHN